MTEQSDNRHGNRGWYEQHYCSRKIWLHWEEMRPWNLIDVKTTMVFTNLIFEMERNLPWSALEKQAPAVHEKVNVTSRS